MSIASHRRAMAARCLAFILTAAGVALAPTGRVLAQTSTVLTQEYERASGSPRFPPNQSYTELFDLDFDLDFSSITFTPDGSEVFYRACRAPAAAFSVDPAGGTVLDLGDDDTIRVDLTEGRTVSLYGTAASRFFVGSNGYLTFGREDEAYEPIFTKHFNLPRIAAFFTDLDPRNIPTPPITWKQLPDRVAVTWLDIPRRNVVATINNDFQIELFFDGRIRITWLDVTNGSVLSGLSQGAGLPSGFSETDLSTLQACASCDHEVCSAGSPLAGSCSPCAEAVCAADSFCCADTWDSVCVAQAVCLCNEPCQCGNGDIDDACMEPKSNETCDDGERTGGDGCGIDCQLETCGDLLVEGSEECDDGNTAAGDACDADCALEPGFCDVVFRFFDSAAPVGSLQSLDIRAFYSDFTTTLVTDGPAPACRPLITTDTFSFTQGDVDLLQVVDLSLTMPSSVVYGPIDVTSCLFHLTNPAAVTMDEGTVVPNVTADSYGGGVDSASPSMTVSRITCGQPAVCGDGQTEGAEECDDANNVAEDGCESDCTATPFDYLTELFAAGDNDLAFSSLTFTPDASPDGYRVCRRTGISAFEVDPADGQEVAPEAGDSFLVTLADDRQVRLHSALASAIYLGSNGSITLGRGIDSDPTIDGHFALPRISGLLSSLDVETSPEGRLSWQQLADRVVATWQDIAPADTLDPATGNHFQIELFFDGRIRLTWLALPHGKGVVGLSPNFGVPLDFAESDFSLDAECPALCSHEPCSSGARLEPECSACAAAVCAVDPVCCSSVWDGLCVEEAVVACGLPCACGDTEVAMKLDETCDDGNTAAGDGCDAQCLLETCGDGDTDVIIEECDDLDTTDADGCDHACRLETGYCEMLIEVSHQSLPVHPVTLLEIEVDFAAAGGAFIALDGDRICLPDNPAWRTTQVLSNESDQLALSIDADAGLFYGPRHLFRCIFALDDPTDAPAVQDFTFEVSGGQNQVAGIRQLHCNTLDVCGNGAPEPTEACDDGNLVDGDGCDSNCTLTACGNAITTGIEACDDGNANNGDGCDNNCTFTACGNAITAGAEACDDGNVLFIDGERCAADCRLIACGKPTDSPGVLPQARDALFTLRSAVGQRTCVPQVCDVDNSGQVTATDALRILRKAVGQEIILDCFE